MDTCITVDLSIPSTVRKFKLQKDYEEKLPWRQNHPKKNGSARAKLTGKSARWFLNHLLLQLEV